MVKNIIDILRSAARIIPFAEMRLDEIKLNQGKILTELQKTQSFRKLSDYGFKIFSQMDEDGIIQRLIHNIEIKNRTFIEFGAEDFFESNCRFLMMNNNWSGYVIDGSRDNINRLKNSYFYWRHDLSAVQAFVTRKNINELLRASGFNEDLGLLSIDLDGVDYWIFEEIYYYKPRILILEYNSVLGKDRKITVPYEDNFIRRDKHYSDLYWGASLGAMAHLAQSRGYSLVGTNSAGCNAFFVRNDLLNARISAAAIEDVFTLFTARDSRGKDGKLSYLSWDKRLEMIKDLPVINILTGRAEKI